MALSAKPIDEDQEMNEFMSDMGGDGVDIMDMMHRTHQEVSTVSVADDAPLLLAQGTTKVGAVTNDFTGHPLNLNITHANEAPSDPPPAPIKDVATININVTPAVVDNEITINIGMNKQRSASTSEPPPYMDDDLDDYDAKDDLTKEQQKQDGNVNLARYVAQKMDHLADDVMNVDELEQQYRMTKDPENPKNIFVIKFGKDEEQHWRLPWNPTTNLLCAMEPNKLLVEQSKYNAMYVKYSLTPREFKRQMIKRQKVQMRKLKDKNKKYKIQTDSINEMRPTIMKYSSNTTPGANGANLNRPQMIDVPSGLSTISTVSLGGPHSGTINSNLLGVKADTTQRGTFMANNSIMVHSEQTVETAEPTDQQQLITQQQINSLKPAPESHQHVMTPISSQIRPELMKMMNKKKNFQRRVSLSTVGDDEDDDDDDWKDDESSSSNDSEDGVYDERGLKIKEGKNKFHISLDSGTPIEPQRVQRLNAHNEVIDEYVSPDVDEDVANEIKEMRYNTGDLAVPQAAAGQHRGKFGANVQPSIGDGSVLQWKPPKISLETWNAVDVWQGILYLGDEWDALNILEIMHNSIEYFINCAAGYCAFDYERNLKQLWLYNWKTNREKEREKRKLKNRVQREKRRKNRLKKFQRARPEWKGGKTHVLQNSDDSNDSAAEEPVPEMSGLPDGKPEVDLNEASIEEFAAFVTTQSPAMQNNRNSEQMKRYPRKQIRFQKAKNEDIASELEYFKERKEYDIINDLHHEILDLDVDDSDHSSMYDSCISSDEYHYDSDEYDEYITMNDEEIIDKLCPFKFLNIHAHNWEGYRLLDLHMNDVWNFIEECRMKNMNIKQTQSRSQQTKISCLVFCTKSSISMSDLKYEIAGDPNFTQEQLGRAMADIAKQDESEQKWMEENVFGFQQELYDRYLDAINELNENKSNNNAADKSSNNKKSTKQVKDELIRTRKKELYETESAKMYNYEYWTCDDEKFWEEFEMLQTRDQALNRLFASSYDRSATLVLGFMIHSGIRLKQALKALQRNKPNTLRNQSFLRQLIQLDWMKHMFNKPGMRELVPFRDEYECYEIDQYLIEQKHYNLK